VRTLAVVAAVARVIGWRARRGETAAQVRSLHLGDCVTAMVVTTVVMVATATAKASATLGMDTVTAAVAAGAAVTAAVNTAVASTVTATAIAVACGTAFDSMRVRRSQLLRGLRPLTYITHTASAAASLGPACRSTPTLAHFTSPSMRPGATVGGGTHRVSVGACLVVWIVTAAPFRATFAEVPSSSLTVGVTQGLAMALP